MLIQKNDKLYLALVVCFGLLEALFIILQMHKISMIANAIFMQNIAVVTLHTDFVQLMLYMIAVVLCNRIGSAMADNLAFSVKNTASSLLLEKLDRLGGVYGSGKDSGSCFVMLTDGVERLELFFAQFLPQVLKTAITPILFLVFIFPIDWVSGILLFITIPIVIVFMMLIGRFSKHASEQQWSVLQTISGFLHDAMVYLPWLKIWGKAEESAYKVDRIANDFRLRTLKVMQVAFLSAFVLEFFTMIGVALVAVTLGVRLVEGMVGFQMALFVILLAPEFYVPLRTLGSKYHDSINAMSAFKEITSFLNKEEPERGNVSLELKEAPEIVLRDVGYTYKESGVSMENINLHLTPGSKTVVFGESGCGKSTLLALASGMKLAQQGSVTWNTVEINQLSLDTIRSQVGYMGQDIYVFSGTVYDNIAMGDSTITMEQVQQACAAIGFDKIVETFAQGYNTLLGENGRGLSGGQKRMLGMARIFVRDRKFVVCDEPLAGLDVQSEQMVYQALNRLLEGRTALLVSHREEIIHLADRVYFMEQGKLR
ncbi:MAG: thiol reductant ABC exporter subunit CydD [Peptococcaceae bacterium]|nr:thiol reductant ABC exporter subunit CydD [Peptococcaceae bacterium]